MDPDKFQQAWQAQSSQARVTIDTGLLLKEVQRNQRDFRALLTLIDFSQIAVALLLLPVWIYLGVTTASPWSWYLMVAADIWVIGFILVTRARQKRTPNDSGETLLSCLKESLALVEHQIWMQRNVLWWNLLPTAIPLLAFTVHLAWLKSTDWSDAITDVNAFVFVFFLAFFYFVYFINQRMVNSENDFEQRRQELLTLLASLGEESAGEHIAMSRERGDESSTKLRRWIIAAAVSYLVTVVVIVLASEFFESSYDGPRRSSGVAGDSLAMLVADLRKEKNLVGLAAMVTVDGHVEAAAAHGERKKGSGVPLEIGDRWHLGGISKSITATMIARLVESGQMKWTDTVGQIFPDAAIHEDWKPVTLRQLLTDTAGAPANFPREIWHTRPAPGRERIQARREAVLNVMADKPAFPPGERFAYSNVGYSIVGAMAEKVTGTTWEDLVKREVFEPLQLTGVGFGPPQSPDETLPQPRGHRPYLGAKVAVDDDVDNTPIMGPSGNIHMTLSDLCTYATEHLRGELGAGKLLSVETYKLLHAPKLSQYACGWIRKEPGKRSPYALYWHNGSNTLWYAFVAFIPEKNMVVAVTSNDGDFETAEAAAWEIVRARTNASKVEADPTRQDATQRTEYPKQSPFAAVRWNESLPEVQVRDEWFKLVSLNELPASEIMAFSQQTYGKLWRKRFEEDLVELLTQMGHPPQDQVTLVVQSPTSPETRTLEDVAMTEANRAAIYKAAREREQ